MQERTVMASRFKARCLALLDQVELDRVPLIITKRGKPVARLVPIAEAPSGRSTAVSVRLVAEGDAPYYSTDEPWEAST
jgi:prevent-host-death family protein